MADKEIKAAIDRRNEQRARGLLNYFHEGLGLDGATEGKALSDALDWAATDMRETAELYLQAQMRGGKSYADNLKTQSAGFALMAAGLRKLPAQRAEVPPAGELPVEILPTAKPGAVQAFVAERVAIERTGRNECPECGEVPTGTTVTVGEDVWLPDTQQWSTAPGETVYTPCMHPIGTRQADGSLLTKADEVADYLSGASEETPVLQFEDPAPAPWASGPDGDRAEDPAPVTDLGIVRMVERPPGSGRWENAEPLSLTAPAGPAVVGLEYTTGERVALPPSLPAGMQTAGPTWRTIAAAFTQFEDPAPPSWKRDPGGARVTFADLRALLGKGFEATGLPAHVSHSQIDNFGGGCRAQAIMQRSTTLGVVQVPQWANVGGHAYHYAVEEIEKLLHGSNAAAAAEGVKASGGSAKIWNRAFRRAMQETADASPVPIERWRASNKGLENQTWWQVNGETMLQRYVDARLAELESAWRRLEHVELQFEIDVEGVPFKGFIDQVWAVLQAEGPMRPGDVLIDDLKSGKTDPTRQQLGRYAQALVRQLQGTTPISSKVWGRFWDARKGTWSAPIDLLADYTADALTLDVLGTDASKRSGAFLPRETTFCGGCSVKHACPIFATRAS
jgi:hypothetical protein